MEDTQNTQDNGELTDEALLKISDINIADVEKYSNGDRKRREDLTAAARLERYKKDPKGFIEVKPEIIACMIRTPYGPMSRIAGSKLELQVAWAELNMGIQDTIRQLELESAMKKKSIIHHAGGFWHGKRGLKRR